LAHREKTKSLRTKDGPLRISIIDDASFRHALTLVMDRQGKKLVHTNVKDNDFAFFLKLVQPYRHSVTVCCECMFGWYWLADACLEAGLSFVLAHALYVRAIHGGKNKNDRIDSEKLTHLLRSNLIPPAYVYPATLRPVRALLRQQVCYVWRRSELLARIYSFQLAYNRIPVRQSRRNREPWKERFLAQEDHPLRRFALQNDWAMIVQYDTQISALEQLQALSSKLPIGNEVGTPVLKTLGRNYNVSLLDVFFPLHVRA
jgi:transposase